MLRGAKERARQRDKGVERKETPNLGEAGRLPLASKSSLYSELVISIKLFFRLDLFSIIWADCRSSDTKLLVFYFFLIEQQVGDSGLHDEILVHSSSLLHRSVYIEPSPFADHNLIIQVRLILIIDFESFVVNSSLLCILFIIEHH